MYEGLVCVCCLGSEEDQLLDLFSQDQDENEDYSRFLQECFEIKVSVAEGHSNVCAPCAARLKDAAQFKRQILAALALLSSADCSYNSKPARIKRKTSTDKADDAKSTKNRKEQKRPVRRKVSDRSSDEDYRDKPSGRQRGKARKKQGKDESERSLRARKIKRESDQKGPIRLAVPCAFPPYKLEAARLECRECPERFRNLHTLTEHLNSHYRNYGCRACDKAFMTIGGWKRHQRTHAVGPFPCKYCDKVFGNENTRMSHERLTHGRAPSYACSECGARFDSLYRRLVHMRDAHGRSDQYPCPHCDRSFLIATWRSRHIRVKHKSDRFGCALCPFTSKWRPVVRNHLASKHQVGEKRHPCQYCGKRFARRTTLKEHVRSHLDDRQYQCEFCESTFVQKVSLKSHLQSHVKRDEISPEQLESADTAPKAKIDSLGEVIAKMHADNEGRASDAGADQESYVEDYEQYIRALTEDEMEDSQEKRSVASSDMEPEFLQDETDISDSEFAGE